MKNKLKKDMDIFLEELDSGGSISYPLFEDEVRFLLTLLKEND